jgi:hypothetical protein
MPQQEALIIAGTECWMEIVLYGKQPVQLAAKQAGGCMRAAGRAVRCTADWRRAAHLMYVMMYVCCMAA